MSDAVLTALAAADDGNPAALLDAVADAFAAGHHAAVRDRLAPLLARGGGTAPLWQYLGLAERELQDSAAAHAAFAEAARLAPADPLIAHSHARTALEAGYPAVALFDRARLVAPGDGAVALGRLAALLAEGRGETALTDAEAVLAANPGWTEGHLAFAGLAAMLGRGAEGDRTLRRALAVHPRAGALWQALYSVKSRIPDHPAALELVREARAALGPEPELDRLEAIELTEAGDPAAALAIFTRLPPPDEGEAATWPVRALIRLGRHDEAARRAEATVATNDTALWPYRALLWRLTGDSRWEWLEGDPRLIGRYDIGGAIADMPALIEVLRSLHGVRGRPLDQSVRHGTQSDGNLLARAEPELRQLRAALLEALAAHVAQLPPPDPRHPTLPARRDPVRIAGSWSIRLTGAGFHVDHVHWQGWLSTACHLLVPPEDPADPLGAHLTFGECRDLLPDLAPFRHFAPEPGKLVVFPSTMWHGTRPFAAGERITVAVDVARP